MNERHAQTIAELAVQWIERREASRQARARRKQRAIAWMEDNGTDSYDPNDPDFVAATKAEHEAYRASMRLEKSARAKLTHAVARYRREHPND